MKKLLIVILILFSIGGGIYYYLHQGKLKDFEPQIKERLNKLVMDASNGLYHLEIEKLETDIVSSKIILINAHLIPDTLVYAKLEQAKMAPDDIFDISISQLSLDDIVPAEFMANRAIKLGNIFINKPIITVWHKKHSFNQVDIDSTKTVYEKIRKDISSIRLDTIIVQNADLIYKNRTLGNKETKLSNVKLFFSDLLLDSTSQFDRQRFLFAKKCSININDYTINTSDGLYKFNVGSIEVQTTNKTLQLKKVQFLPRIPIQAFYKRIKHQQDRFDINVNQVDFVNVDWWTILAEESLIMEKVLLQNGSIKVYNDKSQPADIRSKVGKYPHQMLMKLPFLLKLDTLSINNVDVSYTELNPKSGEPGTLYFDNIKADLTNITNDPIQVKVNPFMKVRAKATFMKKAPLTAGFSFNLANYKNGNFTVSASLGSLQAESLNGITIPLGMLKVNQVNIKSLDVTIKGDNYQGSGTVTMVYDNLNITALKSSDDTLKKRGLISFIANTFIIKKENPFKNKPVRTENASYRRDTKRSFFNLVWKTIFSGAGKTVGYSTKK